MDSPELGSTGNRKAVLTYAQAKAFAYRLLAEISAMRLVIQTDHDPGAQD
jgi:hypothetical protein